MKKNTVKLLAGKFSFNDITAAIKAGNGKAKIKTVK
jgi:hypothetical protein